MAEAVAGKVLGPRPGKAIVSFWQGDVEILLRCLSAGVAALPALVAAAVALGTLSLDGTVSSFSNTPLGERTFGSAGWVIGVAGLAILIEVLVIVIRFCNIGLVNLMIKGFLIVDVILSTLLALGLGAGGVAMAVFATDWITFNAAARQIRDALAASTAFSLLGFLLFGFLAVWVLIYLVKNWNKKVVEYTLKDAVTP